MRPGLFSLGTDFGNGATDARFFPRDATTARYLTEKARILAAFPERDARTLQSEADHQVLSAATAWFAATLASEGLVRESETSSEQLGRVFVEDFVVSRRDAAGVDRALWTHVCFPSGWRPEHVLGRSFAQIHAKIPGMGAVLGKSRALVDAMVERGPYVRFVWTITADEELDHHPEQGFRASWSPSTARAFLRVERQVTVPLPHVSGSVFLIRTYLYGFEELSSEERQTLGSALAQMPPEIRHYKGLESAVPHALALLRT